MNNNGGLEQRFTEIDIKFTGLKFRVTDHDIRQVYALLRMIRQEEMIHLEAFFRYHNSDEPVVRNRRKQEINFVGYSNFPFSYEGIKGFVEERGIELKLPERYHELLREKESLEQYYKEVPASQRRLPRSERKKLQRQTLHQIRDVESRAQSLYIEAALREAGIAWMKTLPEKVKAYAEQDGRAPEYGGVGGGPYLVNWLRFYTYPADKMTWGVPLYSGSFGAGRRR